MSLYDKASLVQIPSGYKGGSPNGTLYSVLPANGDGDFTHTRASSATRVNKDGLIESVASGVPRLDYPLLDGVVQSCPALLLEPSRTNLVLYSEDYGNSSWIKLNGSVTTDTTISVDGSLNADSFIPNTTSGIHALRSNLFNQSSTASHSWFVKANGYSKVAVRESELVGNYATFDLSSGTIISTNQTGSIINYGNGWYRLTLIDTTTGTNAQTSIVVLPDSYTSGNPIFNWSGDGVKGVYVFGAQVELGNYPTSYIKTTTPQVTRSADVCNGAGTSAEFNDSEGVLFAEIAALADDLTYRSVSISDGTTSNRISLSYIITSNVASGYVNTTSGVAFSSSITINNITENNKFAIKYKSGDYSFWINGFKMSTGSSTNIFANGTLNTLTFDKGNGGDDMYSNTKQLMAFNEALTDSELEQITSWRSFDEMATGQLYTVY